MFLAEMETVVPWSRLAVLIEPCCPKKGNGRSPMPLSTMLRQFAELEAFVDAMPDESAILRFRPLLEAHNLAVAIFAVVNAVLSESGLPIKRGTVVDVTLIAASSSTKNDDKSVIPKYVNREGAVSDISG